MNRDEASEILELSPHASAAERSAQYDTLRRQLEDKLAKAPTPGLREKYRHNLKQLEEAFALLAQTDDSAALPVIQKQGAGSKEPGVQPSRYTDANAGLAPSSTLHAPRSARTKSGGREFAIVASIALAVLGAGGWFVMKTRAENEEKARIAGEAKAGADRITSTTKAEAERQAQLAREKTEQERLAAEAKRQADEAEKGRLAATARAEQERLEKLAAQVRVGFSEANLLWEQAERAENAAERDLSDLKSTVRSARDLPAGERRELELRLEAQTDYHHWLADQLITHPARRAKVRTEEMLNTRQPDSAGEALAQYQQALAGLLDQIKQRKPTDADLFGSLAILSEPAGIAWELTDAFGRKSTGNTPATVGRVGIGQASVVFRRPDWNDQPVSAMVSARKEAKVDFSYRPAALSVTTQPAGADIILQGKQVGRSPLTLSELPIREQVLEVRLADHRVRTEKINLRPGETTKVTLELTRLTDQEIIIDFSNRWKGVWGGNLSGIAFQCRFTAGSTDYTEWNTTGRFAGNPPVRVGLEVISRHPLSLNRVWLLNGQKVSFGHFKEENGRLIYVAVRGSRSVSAPVSRVSD